MKIGISPRGSISLMLASKGCAMIEGRSFVIPDDVQRMAFPVLCHRLILQGRLRQQTDAKSIIANILRTTPVPAAR